MSPRSEQVKEVKCAYPGCNRSSSWIVAGRKESGLCSKHADLFAAPKTKEN